MFCVHVLDELFSVDVVGLLEYEHTSKCARDDCMHSRFVFYYHFVVINMHVLHRWSVVATMNTTDCTAYVDFNVPGFANAPPIGLKATVWELSRSLPAGTVAKYAIEFTDLSGRLSPMTVPMTTYVQVDGSKGDDIILPVTVTVPAFNSNKILHSNDDKRRGAVFSVYVMYAMLREVHALQAIGEHAMIECV